MGEILHRILGKYGVCYKSSTTYLPIYIIYTLEDLEVNHLKFKQWLFQLDDKAFLTEWWSINSKSVPRTSRVYICIYIYIQNKHPHIKARCILYTVRIYNIPRTQLTSIFEGQPSKTRPFSSLFNQNKGHLGSRYVYMYVHIYIYIPYQAFHLSPKIFQIHPPALPLFPQLF